MRRSRRFVWLAAAAAAAVLLAGCDLGVPATKYPVEGSNLGVRDLDGDGDLDLMVGGRTLANDGDGGFSLVDLPIPPGRVDLNGDGHLDRVESWRVDPPPPEPCDLGMGGWCPPPPMSTVGVSRWLNDGAGGFGPELVIASRQIAANDQDSTVLLVEDLTVDGYPDLILDDASRGSLRTFVGDGAGGFASPVASGRPAIVAGESRTLDMNDDGFVDLVMGGVGFNLAGGFDGLFAVLWGDGSGAFPTSGEFRSIDLPDGGLVGVSSLEIGDYNGDGHLDLVGTHRSSDVELDNLSLLLGDGVGGFAPAVERAGPEGLEVTESGDFDGDGSDDLAVRASTYDEGSGTWHNRAAILFGAAADQFSESHHLAVEAGGMVAADFNGDGKPDLAFGGTEVTVFLNGWDGRP